MENEKVEEDEESKKPKKVELPEYNPIWTCPICKEKLPMWKIHLGVLDEEPSVAHNFCPADGPDGTIVYLCMKCKMTNNASRQGGAKWS